MRLTLALVLVATLLWRCSNDTKQTETNFLSVDSPTTIDLSQYHTKQDTVAIATVLGDTLKFSKMKFDAIVDSHPEFFKTHPDNPELTYFTADNLDGLGVFQNYMGVR